MVKRNLLLILLFFIISILIFAIMNYGKESDDVIKGHSSINNIHLLKCSNMADYPMTGKITCLGFK